jgi:glycerol uptake facilitator-like aquaporin
MTLVTTSINNVNQATKSLQPWNALWHIPALAIFICACAPASGGHLSPSITMGTLVTGMITPTRAFMYVVAQFLGALLGGLFIRESLPPDLAPLGLCYINLTSVGPGLTPSQALCAEFCFTFILLFIAWHGTYFVKETH